MFRKSWWVVFLIFPLVAFSSCVFGEAVDFPTRDIILICPFKAGGGYDIQLRGLAPYFEKHLPGDKNVIVQNVEGGGGIVAAHHVWAAKPDGHIILQWGLVPCMTSEVIYSEDVRYKTTEFQWLGQYAFDIKGLLINPNLPVKDWKDLIEYNKTHKLRWATTGRGGPAHSEALVVVEEAGFNVDFIHYPGSSGAQAGFARGEADAIVLSLPTCIRWMKSGDAKFFLIFDDKRHHWAPDVPTGLEIGMPEDVFWSIVNSPLIGTPRALAVSPGTPKEIVRLLRKVFWEAVNDPGFKEWCEKTKNQWVPVEGEEFQRWVEKSFAQLKGMEDKLKKIAKE